MSRSTHAESVPLPAIVRDILLRTVPEDELGNWTLEAILAEAVRGHKISRNRAATLLGLEDYESRESFFTRHDLFNPYTVEMVEEDFETIRVFQAKRQQS